MCWTWDCNACRSNNMRCALLCASDFDLDFSVRSHYGGNMNTKITIKSTFNIYRSWCSFCPSVRKTSPNKGQQPCRHSQACKTQIVTILETQRSQWTRCWETCNGFENVSIFRTVDQLGSAFVTHCGLWYNRRHGSRDAAFGAIVWE